MAQNSDLGKIKFGLIGCGRISNQHLASISLLPEAELIAVCDIKENRAKAVAEQYKVDWYSDYHDLLKRDDIDVVCICTPHGLHASMAIDAAKSGKHVLMEKPLGLSEKEISDMFLAFRENHRKLYPVLQVRYNPPLRFLKSVLDQNGLGKIHNAAFVARWNRPQKYFDDDEWRGTKDMEGALLFSQGTHYIDVLHWLLGPVDSVFAKKSTVGHMIETDDLALALLKFKNGTFATLEFTLCTYPKNLECSLSVLGSKGTVKISGAALNELEIWEVEGIARPTLAAGFNPNVYAGGLYQGSPPNHAYVYQDLIKDLKGLPNSHISALEAEKSLAISTAIYRSAAEGKEIFLKNQ